MSLVAVCEFCHSAVARTDRALAMGFKADDGFEPVVRDYLETEGITV